MRKIDVYPHILPPKYFEKLRDTVTGRAAQNIRKRVLNIPAIYDLDERFSVMDGFGNYQQVLTLASPPIESLGTVEQSRDMARLANDELAELVAQYPDRFVGFAASLPMNDPDAALNEANRAMGELGALGVQMHTHVNGKALDAPEFEPIFAAVDSFGGAVWLHPGRHSQWSDYPTEDHSKYEIWWLFGWPYETAVCMARLVFSGLLDRMPNLKLLTHHGGGIAPQCAGRIAEGMDQYGSRTLPEEGPMGHQLQGRPVDYFKRFYGDTAMFGSRDALISSLAFFGVDHIMFGTDMPFDPEKGPGFIRGSIRDLESIDLSNEDLEKIYSTNAMKLLGIS